MPEPEALARLRQLSPNLSRPFLLHVGGNQWYKNRLGALRIFFCLRNLVSDPAFKLVMVGKPWTAEMRRFVYENNMSEVTLELTAGTDEDLQALYSTASMILFPSLQEGFGWPIIEAQSCGCPVATSKRSPMVEVAGDAGIFIDPEDPESAAFIVQQALADKAGRREASLVNAARFRSGMVASYLSLYNRLCTEKKPGWAGEPNESMARPSICATSGGQ
jgi:glycosyltransferase involved in cell wall biosynthesis